jgi:type II secretory pathway component GspD/PulD (secretin)
VVTTDNGKAKISISQQFPIPSYAYSEAQAQFLISGFEYKDIGIVLNVTPRINKNQFITLEVTPEVSDSDKTTPLAGAGASANIPIINTRLATTTVLIKSGNTLAIGGLTGVTTKENMTKVPLLGDIPGLGVLFRSKSLEKKKRELLIFLTPTIVDPETPATGYEKYINGFPAEDAYTDDKWLPKDNARPRDLLKKSKAPQADDTASR